MNERVDDNTELKKCQEALLKSLPQMTPEIGASLYESAKSYTGKLYKLGGFSKFEPYDLTGQDVQKLKDTIKGLDRATVQYTAIITELEKAHLRYEAVRKLNPVQFTKLCQLNIRSGEAFDSLVDRIASGELVL